MNTEKEELKVSQCDSMCDECINNCTRDWGHTGPHRCDTHARH